MQLESFSLKLLSNEKKGIDCSMKKHPDLIYRYVSFLTVLIIYLILTGCGGTQKDFYENGPLRYEINKKKGRYNGKATFYYENGLKQHECFYSNDSLQGKSTRWYNNGKVYASEHFKDNRLHGKALYYDKNGKKEREENYHLDTLHGVYTIYYTSGQAKIQGTYYKGLFDGQWLYFEDDGIIIGMGNYSKGTGKQRAWYRNSTLKQEVNYLDNEKHGKETWYNADGSILKILTYDHDELISTEEFETHE